jgi:integrase
MAAIEKRRTKAGQVRYRVRTRSRGAGGGSATFARLADARKYAHTVEGQIAEGRYFPQAESRRHTLADAITRYVDTVLSRKRISTAKQQRQQLQWWTARIGHLRLCDVTSGVIAEHRDALSREIKEGSVNRYLSALSHVFTVCSKEWRWTVDHPMRNVRRLKEPRGRVRYLDTDERHRLLEACKASGHPDLYLAVVLALSTGARKNEILRLKWTQIGAGYTGITLHDTKNGESRAVPVCEPALSLLRAHARRPVTHLEWVFPGRRGRGPTKIDKPWYEARRVAGIEDFRFHDLRHTTASYLAMNGASLSEIAAVLGHKSFAQVKRYAHLSEAHTADVLSRMNARFLS